MSRVEKVSKSISRVPGGPHPVSHRVPAPAAVVDTGNEDEIHLGPLPAVRNPKRGMRSGAVQNLGTGPGRRLDPGDRKVDRRARRPDRAARYHAGRWKGGPLCPDSPLRRSVPSRAERVSMPTWRPSRPRRRAGTGIRNTAPTPPSSSAEPSTTPGWTTSSSPNTGRPPGSGPRSWWPSKRTRSGSTSCTGAASFWRTRSALNPFLPGHHLGDVLRILSAHVAMVQQNLPCLGRAGPWAVR